MLIVNAKNSSSSRPNLVLAPSLYSDSSVPLPLLLTDGGGRDGPRAHRGGHPRHGWHAARLGTINKNRADGPWPDRRRVDQRTFPVGLVPTAQ